MDETATNWDSIPDIITKDQLYQICHISKSTALYLLRSGKIPCEYTGKKTRCYKIKKADVITYLEKRKVFPESYSAPAGWYKGNYAVKMSAEVPEQTLENMRLYYTELCELKKEQLEKENYVLLEPNCKLNLVSVPLPLGKSECELEDLFSEETLNIEIGGRKFSRKDENPQKYYNKDIFSKYIFQNYEKIDFTGFKPLLNILNMLNESNG